jgi:lipopolysaccharide export system protein LptA
MKLLLKKNPRLIYPAIFLSLFLIANSPSPAFPAAKSNTAASPDKIFKSDSPLHIGSDRMEVSQNDKTITFEGHVVVQQDDLTITGKRMKVFAAGADKKAQPGMMDKIDRIEVEGDVKISQRDKVATSDKAVYYHQEQKIVLIGSPSVSQGKDMVQGRLITLYVAQGRSVVEGGQENPVQAILHPKGKD